MLIYLNDKISVIHKSRCCQIREIIRQLGIKMQYDTDTVQFIQVNYRLIHFHIIFA